MHHSIHRGIHTLLLAGLLGAASTWPAYAQTDDGATGDEERLVRRVVEEVLRELREGDALKEAIQAGITDFVAEQRQARADGRRARARRAADLAKNVRPATPGRDHVFGNPDAVISLIEYSDFECPYCKRFHATAKQVVAESGGVVNWVYRHFPLSSHNPGAQQQAEAAECAGELGGNKAFWAYTDSIYERTRSGGRGFSRRRLTPLAEEIGLDAGDFAACLESGRHRARVQEDFEEGTRAGVSGTPGNILRNNETGEVAVLAGAVPAANIKAEIERLLK